MLNIIKQKIKMKKGLKQKLEFICNFCNTIPTIINCSIRKSDKTNYDEYKNLMDKREKLWKQYHKVKNEEDKSKILAEINDIQPKIKEFRKYDKYCKDIKERAKSMQDNINNFDKDIQKEKDNSRSL